MSFDVGRRGILARVRKVMDDGSTLYLEYPNGQFGVIQGAFDLRPAVGTVLLVNLEDNNMEVAPADLWPDATWVGVVRLKQPALQVSVVDANGRWKLIPAEASVAYEVGNTVEASDFGGVIRVLSDDPLKLFDLPSVDVESIVKSFLATKTGDGETFEDFGGLKSVVAQARELIEVPFTERARLEVIRASPIKGVLFTGDPGVGKTMLARIIANETDAVFYEVSGPEITSKWYGQSEEILRELFEDAQRHPRAMIFFDEIDSIAAHRTAEAHEASRRLVSQLLTLMDGFTAESHIIVIAATNRPQDIDVALRRPGRFDWEIVFPLPDVTDRKEILEKAAQKHNTAGALPHSLIASQTDGWSGADLMAIWKQAALVAAADHRDAILEEDYLIGHYRVAALRTLRAHDKPGTGQG